MNLIKSNLFTAAIVLTASLLLYLWFTPNIEIRQRCEEIGYETIDTVSYQELSDSDITTGMIREFCFRLDGPIEYDTCLTFYFSHQNVTVYLNDEKVYSLQTAEALSIIRTPGSNWAVIPLCREDIGKEVRVVMTPVYKDYQNEEIRFLIGSQIAIYRDTFLHSLPELALSMINILTGVILFVIAVCFSIQKQSGAGFYTLALLAVSLGLWNFTQTEFTPFFMKEKTVFLYYVSLTMLMLCVVPMIKSVKKTGSRIIDGWCIFCSISSVVQLVIQLLGICDLRQMLKVTHILIIISAFALIISNIHTFNGKRNSSIWLLGIGTLLDMSLYYSSGSSFRLIFVLISIFCYVLIEGIHLFLSYQEQKEKLEKQETQLKLSRISTMMSQIRLHFVFNVLNAISGMCKYDPEKADETIVHFARYLRNNIDIMEDDRPILFTRELECLEEYVFLEQIRFGDKVEFYTDITVDQFMIPPLILQPVVENSIKHGLVKKKNGGTVILRTLEEEENIRIIVEDDGVGFEMDKLEKEKSVGLRNIRYRLQHLVHGVVEIESQVNTGTIVTITIPKKEVMECM